jgi:glycoprotein 6-alpha-L-fucosyltransferase
MILKSKSSISFIKSIHFLYFLRQFKDYDFIFDREVAKSASVNQRYSSEALKGIIMDIHYLSKCDYLVCTFSSQVCRMAYELLQLRYADGSWRFKSLDDIYYFGGQSAHHVIAVMDHSPQTPNEIEIKIGDKIGIAGNHWDGYSKGTNRRTGQNGLFPSYKVKDLVQAV